MEDASRANGLFIARAMLRYNGKGDFHPKAKTCSNYFPGTSTVSIRISGMHPVAER
jgi:hypothetical protein